jgi:chemotaxis protein methyltransferase WspC
MSIPCATGEEPYSMAIALSEAGLASRRVRIDAVDISRRALEKAAAALYGARAVRYVGAERLGRSFTTFEGRHLVNGDIRERVSFARGNLVDERLLASRARYDVIFCRNVLMYFTGDARARVLATLEAALHDDGVLVTGHAEGMTVVAPRFVSARVPGTFAYRKAPPVQVGAKVPPSRVVRPTKPAHATLSRARGGLPRRPAAPPPGAAVTRVPSLDEVQRLADAGRLEPALAACRSHLAGAPGSARGYYLLGLIESARGERAAAEAALRRAIYLDPSHAEAMEYLANERRRAGDASEAAQLTRRAALVRARGR